MTAEIDVRADVDLGGRILDVILIPGHSKVSIAFYDRNTGVLALRRRLLRDKAS